jgi:hypothetical protein
MTQNNERNEAHLAGTGNATEVLLFGHVAFVVKFPYDWINHILQRREPLFQ